MYFTNLVSKNIKKKEYNRYFARLAEHYYLKIVYHLTKRLNILGIFINMALICYTI